MGGFGSGRWPGGYSRLTTVETCLQLPICKMWREGLLRPGKEILCSVDIGAAPFRIEFRIDLRDVGRPSCQLRYQIPNTNRSLEYMLALTTTCPYWGGLRFWFVCPLVSPSGPCCRRVGKLYLPQGSRYFGCRRCHQLSYKSVERYEQRVASERAERSLAKMVDRFTREWEAFEGSRLSLGGRDRSGAKQRPGRLGMAQTGRFDNR